MMTNEQFLLMKLGEEGTEIAQMAMKTMQFGMFGTHESRAGQEFTNLERLHSELNDLMASIRMLNSECGFGFEPNEEAIQAKIAKVNKYREYSRNLGTVQPILKTAILA